MNEKGSNIVIRLIGIIHANKDSKAHIHNMIIEECGTHDIPYVMSSGIILLFNPRLSLQKLLASIEVLKQRARARERLLRRVTTA